MKIKYIKIDVVGEFYAMLSLLMLNKISKTSKDFAGPVDPRCYWCTGPVIFWVSVEACNNDNDNNNKNDNYNNDNNNNKDNNGKERVLVQLMIWKFTILK